MTRKKIVDYPAHFWSRVQVGEPDQCWPWLSGCDDSGYGRAHLPGHRTQQAHRVAYMLANGLDHLPALPVLHSCDNPPCCNPAHLREGTQAENMAEMVARGRSLRGERNNNAKLTAAQVREILVWHAVGGDAGLIARVYGITRRMVDYITRGKYWQGLVKEVEHVDIQF